MSKGIEHLEELEQAADFTVEVMKRVAEAETSANKGEMLDKLHKEMLAREIKDLFNVAAGCQLLAKSAQIISNMARSCVQEKLRADPRKTYELLDMLSELEGKIEADRADGEAVAAAGPDE